MLPAYSNKKETDYREWKQKNITRIYVVSGAREKKEKTRVHAKPKPALGQQRQHSQQKGSHSRAAIIT